MPVLNSVTLWGGGKQPEDTYTRELPELGTAAPHVKRGRGRPRKDDALTPAQRAQRYRDKKKRYAWLEKNRRTAMYRCPLTGATWTGRGLMPKWLAVKVRDGVDKSFYLVKS